MDRDRTPGVPLSHYIDTHPGVGVRFTCLYCMAHHDVPIAEVVVRLKARGMGDEQTGIRTIGLRATQPCGRCGKVTWETIPAWSGRVGPKGTA